MSRYRKPEDAYDALRRDQHGVFTREQARARGVSDGLIRAHLDGGRWRRLAPGIVVNHNGPVDDQSLTWWAFLGCGEGALISQESSWFMHGIVDKRPSDVHVHGCCVTADPLSDRGGGSPNSA
jgi:hypothetical protein